LKEAQLLTIHQCGRKKQRFTVQSLGKMNKPMARIKIIFLVVIFQVPWIVYAKCPGEWLGDMLGFENPRVMKELKAIESKGKGFRVQGINLCDDSKILENWVFKRSLEPLCSGQHIYLFEEGDTLRAVVWVGVGGKPIKVPPCPGGDCSNMNEPAGVISGDIYTWNEVQPGHGVVLLFYPTNEWVQNLTKQSSGCGKPPR
jgi:hypothetical protein